MRPAFGIVYDPIETLADVAAQTSRITLGTSVLDALFQSPIILARRVATLDQGHASRLGSGPCQLRGPLLPHPRG
jgi:alkanesulfonate monooxygenase SsuD/methylene tetrahydromethanopterin reductase-like flavin-dependent oxidoreductase (luciferase family)